jgi:hypothetical protein
LTFLERKSLKSFTTLLDPGDTGSLGGTGTSDLLRSLVIGSGVAEAATTITLLGNNGTGALAGPEATAARVALFITVAGAGNELSARGLAGTTVRGRSGRSRGRGRSRTSTCTYSSAEVEGLTRLEVGAASVDAGIGSHDGRNGGATSGGDLAASITRLNDNTSGGSSSSTSGSGRCLSGNRDSSSALGIGTLQGDCSAVIGEGISEATAAVTALRDDGTGTLASGEGTAVGRAFSVVDAGTGNELAARGDTGENRSGGKEGQVGNEERSRDVNHV